MHDKQVAAPDNTAVRVALWRALHVEVDSPPHVFEDEVGLKLAAPDDGWRGRPDMSPFTRPFRASIVARDRGDAAPGRGARSGLHARHVVHASDRAGGPRGASRD